MIRKTSMTIDAYLREAGLKPVCTTNRKNFIPLKTRLNPSFSEDLAAAISSPPQESIKPKAGLTIADYLNQTTTGLSTHFFRNSTIRNDSLHPGSLHMFSSNIVPSKKDRIDTPTAIFGSSTDAGPDDNTSLDSETLIADCIKSAAKKYQLPEKLIKNVIQAESNFQVDAVSPAGAQGLMQLMPATAKELGVTDPFNIQQNIDGGAFYLRQMMDRFGGDVRLALTAYNAGPGTVEKYNGNVPYRETRNYVERVLKGISV